MTKCQFEREAAFRSVHFSGCTPRRQIAQCISPDLHPDSAGSVSNVRTANFTAALCDESARFSVSERDV